MWLLNSTVVTSGRFPHRRDSCPGWTTRGGGWRGTRGQRRRDSEGPASEGKEITGRAPPAGNECAWSDRAPENELLPTVSQPVVSVGGTFRWHESWLNRSSYQENRRTCPLTCLGSPAFASSASAVDDTLGAPLRSLCARACVVGLSVCPSFLKPGYSRSACWYPTQGVAAWGVLFKN